MFAAVRRYVRRWRKLFASGSARTGMKRYSALFLFEFVVVLLGVLAAQMVQDYAAERRASADSQAAIDRTIVETAQARGMARFWLDFAPCLDARLDELMRAAADGGSVPTHYFERPPFPYSPVNRWTEATTLAARRYHGDELVTDFADIADMSQHMLGMTREFSNDWSVLRLIDPRLGSPSAADRSNVRLAAARIRARLDALGFTAHWVIVAADRRGIRRASQTIALPTGCAQPAQAD